MRAQSESATQRHDSPQGDKREAATVRYHRDVRRIIEQWLMKSALRQALTRPSHHGGPSERLRLMDAAHNNNLAGYGAGLDVGALLEDVVRRRPGAEAELLEIVYVELRSIAGSFFKSQRAEHTLQPTALVHEAYLKMMGGSASYENRAHFIGVAAKAMRQVLIGHARSTRAAKRGGGDLGRVSLSGVVIDEAETEIDAIDVHELLERLAQVDPRQAQIVELRFFAGLTVPEVALVLGVSDRTVELDWRMARAWLRRALALSGDDNP